MTTTTTYDYRAQTDPTIKTWHLGAVERGAASFCGVKLLTPGDTRAFALKVPAEKRDYQTDPDVAKVTCGACKRSREYAKATAAPLAEATPSRRAPEPPPRQDRRPARRPGSRRPRRRR